MHRWAILVLAGLMGCGSGVLRGGASTDAAAVDSSVSDSLAHDLADDASSADVFIPPSEDDIFKLVPAGPALTLQEVEQASSATPPSAAGTPPPSTPLIASNSIWETLKATNHFGPDTKTALQWWEQSGFLPPLSGGGAPQALLEDAEKILRKYFYAQTAAKVWEPRCDPNTGQLVQQAVEYSYRDYHLRGCGRNRKNLYRGGPAAFGLEKWIKRYLVLQKYYPTHQLTKDFYKFLWEAAWHLGKFETNLYTARYASSGNHVPRPQKDWHFVTAGEGGHDGHLFAGTNKADVFSKSGVTHGFHRIVKCVKQGNTYVEQYYDSGIVDSDPLRHTNVIDALNLLLLIFRNDANLSQYLIYLHRGYMKAFISRSFGGTLDVWEIPGYNTTVPAWLPKQMSALMMHFHIVMHKLVFTYHVVRHFDQQLADDSWNTFKEILGIYLTYDPESVAGSPYRWHFVGKNLAYLESTKPNFFVVPGSKATPEDPTPSRLINTQWAWATEKLWNWIIGALHYLPAGSPEASFLTTAIADRYLRYRHRDQAPVITRARVENGQLLTTVMKDAHGNDLRNYTKRGGVVGKLGNQTIGQTALRQFYAAKPNQQSGSWGRGLDPWEVADFAHLHDDIYGRTFRQLDDPQRALLCTDFIEEDTPYPYGVVHRYQGQAVYSKGKYVVSATTPDADPVLAGSNTPGTVSDDSVSPPLNTGKSNFRGYWTPNRGRGNVSSVIHNIFVAIQQKDLDGFENALFDYMCINGGRRGGTSDAALAVEQGVDYFNLPISITAGDDNPLSFRHDYRHEPLLIVLGQQDLYSEVFRSYLGL